VFEIKGYGFQVAFCRRRGYLKTAGLFRQNCRIFLAD